MDLKASRTKRKIWIAKLEEWREKRTTSKLRSSNSSQEIRYFFLTLAFIYLVMVIFVVNGKAPT
jgi:hypothetical protein